MDIIRIPYFIPTEEIQHTFARQTVAKINFNEEIISNNRWFD